MPGYPVYDPNSGRWFIWSAVVSAWLDGCIGTLEILTMFPWLKNKRDIFGSGPDTKVVDISAWEQIQKQPDEWLRYITLAKEMPQCPIDLVNMATQFEKLVDELLNSLNERIDELLGREHFWKTRSGRGM